MNDEKIPTNNAISTEKTNKKLNLVGILKELVIFVLIAFGIVLPFRMFIAEPYIVDGLSMYPTFNTGDYLIVDKLSHRFSELERNSVVVFKIVLPGQTAPRNLIKRVIGLPGDTVILDGNKVTIKNTENPDGFSLDQSYVQYDLPGNFQTTLKAGQYFVMGDNRAESYDSRSWGVLPKEDVLGQPVLRLLPVSKIGVLPGKDKK